VTAGISSGSEATDDDRPKSWSNTGEPQGVSVGELVPAVMMRGAMRSPRRRWLLTLSIALCGSLLTTLIVTEYELSVPADALISTSEGPRPRSFSYAAVAYGAFVGLNLGLMVGLIVNAVAMIIEEPRPHW
jgi:hypothetical protein